MLPTKAGCDRDRGISVGGKKFSESVIKNSTGLREALHPISDFDILNMTMMDEGRSRLVFCHDGCGNYGDRDLHVFIYASMGVL
jgi:hypothetical protein